MLFAPRALPPGLYRNAGLGKLKAQAQIQLQQTLQRSPNCHSSIPMTPAHLFNCSTTSVASVVLAKHLLHCCVDCIHSTTTKFHNGVSPTQDRKKRSYELIPPFVGPLDHHFQRREVIGEARLW